MDKSKENRIVMFDLDGTLSDSAEGILNAVEYAHKKHGRMFPGKEESISYIGPPLHLSFMEKWDVGKEEAMKAVASFREYFTSRGIYENHLYPGIRPLIEKLDSCGILMALATSKPQVFAEKIVRRCGIREFFTIIAGSKLDGSMTDKSELIRHVLEVAGCSPESAIMVGDREVDFNGAGAAGVYSVGVEWGYGTPEELSKADITVDNTKNLAKIITKRYFL